MNVIRKVKNRVNFLKTSILTMQRELEKYCLNEINYQYALRLCQICLTTKSIDDMYKLGLVCFAHLLTTYKHYTYQAVANILGKHQNPNYQEIDFTDQMFGDIDNYDFPFLEYILTRVLSQTFNFNVDEWQLIHDKINVLATTKITEFLDSEKLSMQEIKKLDSWKKLVNQYSRATRYLIEIGRTYAQYPINFQIANEISRQCIYSNDLGVRTNAISNIGYASEVYNKKPDSDLIVELTNMYYHPNNIYYQGFIEDANNALHLIEVNNHLSKRPPRIREDLVMYYLEQLSNQEALYQDTIDDYDNDSVWLKINELVEELQTGHSWDEDPADQLGILFINEAEVEIIRQVVAAAKKLINTVGQNQGNDAYLQAPEFVELSQIASLAHHLLSANDVEFRKIYFK